MKKFAVSLVLVVLLTAAVPAQAGLTILSFMDVFAQPPSGWLFWSGYQVHVAWKLTGSATGQEKMNVALLKDGAAVRMLASGISNKFANMGQASANYWYNEYLWTIGPGDVGCHFQVQVTVQNSSLAIKTDMFNIYPFLNIQKNGVNSYARLDTPKAGDVILYGHNYDIKWTANAAHSAWPSGKISLKLMTTSGGAVIHVGDIVTVNIDFNGCPIYGKYSWPAGALFNITHPGKVPDGKNGIKYRIRLTGDSSTYDTDDFLIGTLPHWTVTEGVAIKKK